MRGIERLRDLTPVVQRAIDRQAAARNQLVERPPGHELHDDVIDALVLFDVVDRDDVWVVERGDRASFLLESRSRAGVVLPLRGQDFDGDLALQLGVASPIDLAHPADA